MLAEILNHRLKYFLSPQFDLYRNIREFWVGHRMRVAPSMPMRVLDYGCCTGVGAMLLHYSGDDIVGIDRCGDSISFAKQMFGHLCNFFVEDWGVRKPPESEGAFDLITCIEVLEHVDELKIKTILERFRYALADDGIVVFSTLNHNSQYRKNDCHVGRFTVKTFRELLEPFFPGIFMTDYSLQGVLSDDSSRTPVVAIWGGDSSHAKS
ncbi:MAG: class I SAM-dependent methyltransferase [Candidatus Latescibacterota bacterium]|nr:MAG: class I SAM-dependent methyltransferase [Candidatus Latescibacterota bacterium]